MINMNNHPTISLNNGVEMPQIGFGTYLIPEDKIVDTIGKAYELGYRNFDTAGRYKNEQFIVQAMQKFGIKREDVFLTTKIHTDQLYLNRWHGGALRFFNIPIRTIRRTIDQEFKKLNTDYIDLFLIHFPLPGYLKMWEILTEYYKKGRIRAIGVCSFLPPMFDSLKSVSDVVPVVNQFELSPMNSQKQLVNYCQDRNIQVEAMGTLSHWRSNEPRMEILTNPVLSNLAEQHNKTVAQVIWRWFIQRNIIIIPKTWDDVHIKENINIMDFELSDEDMKTIDTLDGGKFLTYNPYGAIKFVPKEFQGWKGF